MAEKFTILLGDVIHSSQHSGVQKKLHELVEWANKQFMTCWETPLEITRGDEIAVITKPDCAWLQTIISLTDRMRPFRMRWAMSYGEVKEGLIYRSSAEASGPAFVKADHLMHSLKKTSLRFDIFTGISYWDEILRGQINLLLWRLDQLSDLQLEIFRLYQAKKRQIDVAAALGRSQQQVQRALKAMNWQVIDTAEKSTLKLVDLVMKRIVGEDHHLNYESEQSK